MGTDRLTVYNQALAHLGSRRLADLTEAREPRRALDAQWDVQVRHCLEQDNWSFALRTISPDLAPAGPAIGPAYAFVKPSDWLKTANLATDGDFRMAVQRYDDADGYWLCDSYPIFVRYVSIDPAYGLDLTKWPPTFEAFVAVRLARMTCRRITNSSEMVSELEQMEKKTRLDAKSKDAWNTPPRQPPQGSWARARYDDWGNRDRGSSGAPLTVIVDGGEV